MTYLGRCGPLLSTVIKCHSLRGGAGRVWLRCRQCRCRPFTQLAIKHISPIACVRRLHFMLITFMPGFGRAVWSKSLSVYRCTLRGAHIWRRLADWTSQSIHHILMEPCGAACTCVECELTRPKHICVSVLPMSSSQI